MGETIGNQLELNPYILKEKNIRPLISTINSIQGLTLKEIKENNQKILHFKQYDFGVYDYFYDKKVRILRGSLRNYLNDLDINEGKQLLRKNRRLLDSSCNRLSHGDLHGKNIIFKKETDQLFIIDWESIHFNNQAYDPAFFWFRSWCNKKWRSKFLETYLLSVKDKVKFSRLFRSVVIHRALNEIGFWHQEKEKTKNKELKDKSLEALKSHTTTFKKALKSEDLFSY